MLERPGRLNGLRHIALLVPNLEACERFYVDILGMQVLHRANPDLVYLTCGNDNLSLGRASVPSMMISRGRIVAAPELERISIAGRSFDTIRTIVRDEGSPSPAESSLTTTRTNRWPSRSKNLRA